MVISSCCLATSATMNRHSTFCTLTASSLRSSVLFAVHMLKVSTAKSLGRTHWLLVQVLIETAGFTVRFHINKTSFSQATVAWCCISILRIRSWSVWSFWTGIRLLSMTAASTITLNTSTTTYESRKGSWVVLEAWILENIVSLVDGSTI